MKKNKILQLHLLPTIFPTGRKGRRKSTIDDAMKAFVHVQPVSMILYT